jgi:hypothetical protein
MSCKPLLFNSNVCIKWGQATYHGLGLPTPRCVNCVSALQVRLQGCKGVLSRNSLLTGKQLRVRPSMEKFGSTHPQLEVCSVATWLPSYLNRQVITFMVYNGVPEQVRNRPLGWICFTPFYRAAAVRSGSQPRPGRIFSRIGSGAIPFFEDSCPSATLIDGSSNRFTSFVAPMSCDRCGNATMSRRCRDATEWHFVTRPQWFSITLGLHMPFATCCCVESMPRQPFTPLTMECDLQWHQKKILSHKLSIAGADEEA